MVVKQWREVPVFVHGITPEPEPGLHTAHYQSLLDRFTRELNAQGKTDVFAPPVMVEWGWEGSCAADKYLAAAERELASRAFAALPRRRGPAGPVRNFYKSVREYFLYGVADLFYYTSPDGVNAVRANIFTALTDAVKRIEVNAPGDVGVSLTFFAHSAGTIIAYDFLYHLFDPRPKGLFGFGLDDLRKLVRRGKLRVRRFFTMGSPLAPFIFRADALISKVAAGECLDETHIGLVPADGLAGPRWVNFWDEADLFAFPIAYLFQGGARGVVVDQLVDLGDVFPKVHRKYWRDKAVASSAAAVW